MKYATTHNFPGSKGKVQITSIIADAGTLPAHKTFGLQREARADFVFDDVTNTATYAFELPAPRLADATRAVRWFNGRIKSILQSKR